MSIPTGKTWSTNELLTSSDLNTKFGQIITEVNANVAFKGTAATITAVYTFTAAPIISAALSVGGLLTVSTGGAAITGATAIVGNTTITGTCSVSSTLAAGNTTITGTLAVSSTLAAGNTTITGTLAVSSTLTSGAHTVTGTCAATLFSGSGASLTSLPAANLTGTLPAISGANLTSLNADNISSGTIADARLESDIARTNLRASNVVFSDSHSNVAGTATLQLAVGATALFAFPSGMAFDTGTGLQFTINGVTKTIAYT